MFCQREHWLSYLAEEMDLTIHLWRLTLSGETAGYFTAGIFRRLGVRICGSPFDGWGTPHLGFNMLPGFDRKAFVEPLIRHVFETHGCWHFEVSDPALRMEDFGRLKTTTESRNTWVNNLSRSEDELLALMNQSRRYAIRRASKTGVLVEIAEPRGFAVEHYQHLTDTYAKQGLTPPTSIARLERMIERVHPSGDLLLLRVRAPDGRSISSGIFAGYGERSFFLSNGSLRSDQKWNPNEPMHWHAIRHFRDKKIRYHDWNGGGSYKRHYGGEPTTLVRFKVSRSPAIEVARNVARSLYYLPRNMKAIVHRRRQQAAAGKGNAE